MPFFVFRLSTRTRVWHDRRRKSRERMDYIYHARPKRFADRARAERYAARERERRAAQWPRRGVVLVEARDAAEAQRLAREQDVERYRALAARPWEEAPTPRRWWRALRPPWKPLQ